MSMLAFVDVETRVPPVFDHMYADDGRPSIPPARRLKASLLISLYSVCSGRALV